MVCAGRTGVELTDIRVVGRRAASPEAHLRPCSAPETALDTRLSNSLVDCTTTQDKLAMSAAGGDKTGRYIYQAVSPIRPGQRASLSLPVGRQRPFGYKLLLHQVGCAGLTRGHRGLRHLHHRNRPGTPPTTLHRSSVVHSPLYNWGSWVVVRSSTLYIIGNLV